MFKKSGSFTSHRFRRTFLDSVENHRLEQKLLTVPAFVYTGSGSTTVQTNSTTDFDDGNGNGTTGQAVSGASGGNASSQAQSDNLASGGHLEESEAGVDSATVVGTGGNGSTAPQSIGVHGKDQINQSVTDSSPPGQGSSAQSQGEDDSIDSSGNYSWMIQDSNPNNTLAASTINISFSVSSSSADDGTGNFESDTRFVFNSNFFTVNFTGTSLVVQDSNGATLHNDPNFDHSTYTFTKQIPIAAGTTHVPENINFGYLTTAYPNGLYQDATYTGKSSFSWDFTETVSANN